MPDHDEPIDLRRTRHLAVDASLADVRRSLVRAARIPSAFSTELRALLVVADLDRRVIAGNRCVACETTVPRRRQPRRGGASQRP